MANRKGLSTISSLPRLIRQLRTAEWKIVGQNAFPAPYISLQTDSKCFTSRLWNDKCQPRKSSRPRSRFSQTQTLSHGSGDNYGNRCSTTKHTVTPESLLMKIGVLSCLPSRVYSNTANDLERGRPKAKLAKT